MDYVYDTSVVNSPKKRAVLLLLCFITAFAHAGEPKPAALAAWDKYVRLTDARIEQELKKPSTAPATTEVRITRMRTLDERGQPIDPDSAMFHHWKGSVFVPGVNLETVLKFVQNYDAHQRFFKEVEKSRLLSRNGDTFRIFYRLKRTIVITAVYNTEHTVVYRIAGPHDASSRSMTTKIAELDDPGTPKEKEKSPEDNRGFLWRLNSYWRFTERDNGVLVECESVSLSRNIPTGFAWLVRGKVESISRESLINTLTSLRDGVRK